MSCVRCDWPYPDDMLKPVVGSLIKGNACGICALEMLNATHGTRMKRFHGEMAEDFRQRALAWRKKHPNAKPVTEAP